MKSLLRHVNGSSGPWITAAACLALAGWVSGVHGANLLLKMDFNETGTTVVNGGSGGNATLVNFSQTAIDLHSASGGGVSGKAGDRALNNTASTQMGGNGTTPGEGGAAVITNGSSIFNNQQSFTIAGWYNGASAPGNNARLLSAGNVNVYFATTGINLNVAGVSATSNATGEIAEYFQSGKWEFFAITYDGTSTTNNVTFYSGYMNGDGTLSSLTSVTVTLANGTVKANSPSSALDLAIGNSLTSTSVLNRPFDGSLDDFAIWGSTTDASGALSSVAISDYYNLASIPENRVSLSMTLGLLALAVATRKLRPASPARTTLNLH